MESFSTSSFLQVSWVTSEWAALHANDKADVPNEFALAQADVLLSYVEPLSRIGFGASKSTIDKLIETFQQDKCAWPM